MHFRLLCILAFLATPAFASEGTDADARFMKAMDSMRQTMPEATGNADQDFVAMMLPHHQAAIDMAKAELQDGKDPEIKALAQSILDAQEKEIRQMKAWQASR